MERKSRLPNLTDEQLKDVALRYETETAKQIAESLGYSKSAIQHAIRRIGSKKPPRQKQNRKLVKKRAALKYFFGMSLEAFEELLQQQGMACAICGPIPDDSLHVDHDHSTGKIRGLLCRRCNRGIGLLRDDTDVLKNAVAYLEKHRA